VRSLAFPYIRLGSHFVPIIPITLFSRNLAFNTEAYVDSGASYSIFRSEILDTLRLRREEGQLKMLKAADGNLIPVHLFRLAVQIGDVKIRALVGFSDKLNVGFNVLGRHAIFSCFEEVVFNEKARKIIFRQKMRHR